MNAKLLETLIKQGHQVAVKHNDGNWKVFLFINGDGKFEGTTYGDTIEKCLNYGLDGRGYTQERIEERFTDEYKVVTPAPLILEEGDIVEILESFRPLAESLGRNDDRIQYIGNRGKIDSMSLSGYYINCGCGAIWHFPHRAVAKVEKKEEEKEMTVWEIQQALNKFSRELGYKIKIVE